MLAYKTFAVCPPEQRPPGVELSVPWQQQRILRSEAAAFSALGWTVIEETTDIQTVIVQSAPPTEIVDHTPKDADNTPLSRGKTAPIGWTYEYHCFDFSTSTLNSLNHKKADNTDYGFVSIKYYKDETTQCADQPEADTSCVKTVVEWMPTHDFELIGGITNWSDVISSDVHMWVVGVPDIPYAYGGSKSMISNCCLCHFNSKEVRIDGRSSKRLNYNVIYKTNKLRFIYRHPAGYKVDQQIVMEFYKA